MIIAFTKYDVDGQGRAEAFKKTENIMNIKPTQFFFSSKSCLLNLENTILLMVHNNSRSREMKYQLGREGWGQANP